MEVKYVEIIRWKARLSVLWLTMTVGMVSSWFLSTLVPGTMSEIIGGKWGGMDISEGTLLMMTIFILIATAAAILSLTLKNSANRWMNLILGILWFLWMIVETIEHATGEETVYAATWLMLAAGFVIAALIAWFAWKWPKTEA
jgi:hypothetical protein